MGDERWRYRFHGDVVSVAHILVDAETPGGLGRRPLSHCEGTIPPELGKLSALKHLHLACNKLSGECTEVEDIAPGKVMVTYVN